MTCLLLESVLLLVLRGWRHKRVGRWVNPATASPTATAAAATCGIVVPRGGLVLLGSGRGRRRDLLVRWGAVLLVSGTVLGLMS